MTRFSTCSTTSLACPDGRPGASPADHLPTGDVPAEESYRKPRIFFSDLKVSPAKAAEIRSKLEEIAAFLNDEKTEDPDGVPMNLLIGYYVPGDPDGY